MVQSFASTGTASIGCAAMPTQVYYVVDKASSKGWKGGVGYITQDTLRQHMPAPGDKSLVLVCGPPPMMKAISGDKSPDKSQGPLEGMLKVGWGARGGQGLRLVRVSCL
jgi:NAD(P)H-flavin reductase